MDESKKEVRPLKVFFSQPMHGKLSQELYERQKRLVDDLLRLLDREPEEIEVVDQISLSPPADAPKTWNISQDILLMGQADLVCFAYDWDTASGCRIEWAVAKKFNLPHIIMPKEMY